MAESWILNGFFDSTKLTGLYEAVRRRESCRLFASAPCTEKWNALLSAADELALPGMRIALGLCDNTLFQPFMGLLIKFENVQRFAAIIVTDNHPRGMVNAGVSGEMFLLRAVELGLGGCWVSGTYKRSQVGLKVREGEKIVALMPLGVPKVEPEEPIHHKRKEIAALCPDFNSLNPVFREIALYVQSAPSAMNLQPWRIQPQGDKQLQISVPRAAQQLDLGIAISHAVLALGNTPALFSLNDTGLSATIDLL